MRVATGQAYPDALTAGTAAAATGGVLHLTPSFTAATPEAADLRSYLEANAACRGRTIEHAFMQAARSPSPTSWLTSSRAAQLRAVPRGRHAAVHAGR